MNHRLCQLLLIGTLMLTACESAQVATESFASEAGQFTIETPAPFEETQQSVETPVGPIEIRTFSAETEETAYVVAYSDYPSEIVDQTPPEELLDSSRDGAISSLGGTLVSEEEIEIEGNPGRSLVISTDANQNQAATINSRIFLVDNRLYQVLVVAPDGVENTAVADQFLNSFDLQESEQR